MGSGGAADRILGVNDKRALGGHAIGKEGGGALGGVVDELDGAEVRAGLGGVGIGAGDFDDDSAGGAGDGGGEFGAVGGDLDVLSFLRGDIDLRAAGVDAHGHVFHVGGGIELGGQILLHFDQHLVIGSGRRNGS